MSKVKTLFCDSAEMAKGNVPKSPNEVSVKVSFAVVSHVKVVVMIIS